MDLQEELTDLIILTASRTLLGVQFGKARLGQSEKLKALALLFGG